MSYYTTREATTDERNREIERKELAWLSTGPGKVFFYVRLPKHPDEGPVVTTWLGTVVSGNTKLGPRVYTGFGRAYRRHITCELAGEPGRSVGRYHGWYYESSGDYCRLTRCKVKG